MKIVFDLNDKQMMLQCHKMHPEEMEPLYWKVEDAIDDGLTDRARNAFEILAYVAKYRPELLRRLKPCQRQRLKNMALEFSGQAGVKQIQPINVLFGTEPVTLPFIKEEDLQDFLSEHLSLLSGAFNDQVTLVGKEIDTGPGYKCDLVVKSATSLYPIELKIGQAQHGVVSQCNKYCYYFYRRLRYDRHKNVQGVVIANSFDRWTVNELRREGIWIFYIRPDRATTIKLIKID